MKISLLQTDIQWQSPEENRAHAEQLIQTLPDTDLIIFPEMFTTGFCTSPKGIAEKYNSETLTWMQLMAKNNNAAIAGSVATEENGKFYNRLYFVDPTGDFSTYDKRHLFSFAREDKSYNAGNDRAIVTYKGFRILLQICYDLRFPVFARNRNDYEMIIYVANWPIPRIEAWNTLLRARAIENLCYVAAVNRTGNDPACAYNGGTVLLNYMGKEVVATEFGKEEAVWAEIDLQSLVDFRKKFPALNDADDFTLI